VIASPKPKTYRKQNYEHIILRQLKEHPLDRLIRLYKKDNIHVRWEFWGDDEYCWIIGKTATKRWLYSKMPVSILAEHECQICSKRGNGRTVRSCYVYADPVGWVKNAENKIFTILCNSCNWTLEHAGKKYLKCDELLLQIRRYKRKSNESTKNNARAA
jgi:hypothetical protein